MIGSWDLIPDFELTTNGTGGALWETDNPSASMGVARGGSDSRSLRSSAGGSLSPDLSSLSLHRVVEVLYYSFSLFDYC